MVKAGYCFGVVLKLCPHHVLQACFLTLFVVFSVVKLLAAVVAVVLAKSEGHQVQLGLQQATFALPACKALSQHLVRLYQCLILFYGLAQGVIKYLSVQFFLLE